METNNQPLNRNEFYLIVSDFGYVFKTKNKEEFEKVKNWKEGEGVIFADVVKGNQCIWYKCNSKSHRKLISQIKLAIDFGKHYYYDIEKFDLNGYYKIKKIWIGGLRNDEVIEKL